MQSQFYWMPRVDYGNGKQNAIWQISILLIKLANS